MNSYVSSSLSSASQSFASTSSRALKKHSASLSAAYKAALCVLIMLCSGCSLLDTKPEQGDTNTNYYWPDVRDSLSELSSWQLMGKIGIRTPDDSVTAAINNWTQVDDFFDINLSSTFFGLGATRILGNSRVVTLQESGEDPIQSDQPDRLIQEVLGIPLPISHLPFWIRGLPIPDEPYNIEFNKEGLPQALQQYGWSLQFSKYKTIDKLPLPGKIKLKSEHSSITLAIIEWQTHDLNEHN